MDNLTLKDASKWASNLLGKNITPSNISYLIQYARVPKISDNGMVFVSKKDLQNYYTNYYKSKELLWKNKLDANINWCLSFAQYKEAETTKHVHRLHP